MIKGFLLDLDGTVYVGEQLLPEAAETIRYLKSKGYRCLFVTNTTSRSCSSICKKLQSMGLSVNVEEIFGATMAARLFLQPHGRPRVHALVAEDAIEDFRDIIERVDEKADFVILGDIGAEMSFDKLNHAFRLLLDGAEMLALAKNRYWMAADGLRLDAGPFVAALEYATGQEAMLLGKPSLSFFKLALQKLGLKSGEVIMVGDDLEADVTGAQRAGISGFLVKTGKFRSSDLLSTHLRPNRVLDSIADLKRII